MSAVKVALVRLAEAGEETSGQFERKLQDKLCLAVRKRTQSDRARGNATYRQLQSAKQSAKKNNIEIISSAHMSLHVKINWR